MLFECFPGGWHPYQELFARALAPYGITSRSGEEMTDRALRDGRANLDGIHFHWVEHLWTNPSPWKRWRSILGLWRYCRLAKRLGKMIVWTVHNHANHEGARWGDDFGFRIVASFADLIIVHSHWSEDYVRQSFRPSGQIIRMPLGNFDGMYSPQRTPAEVRTALGLDPHRPVCGVVGMIRPYRGHELAVEAIRRINGECQLLIAGLAPDSNYREKVAKLAADCRDVRFHCANLTDTEYAEMVQACDLILLPYQNITGSAALLAAWTLARPVVLSDLPYFKELLPEDKAAGVLMVSRDSLSLADAIRRVLAIPESARALAARREADKYNWQKVVRPVAEAMQRWPSGRTKRMTASAMNEKGLTANLVGGFGKT